MKAIIRRLFSRIGYQKPRTPKITKRDRFDSAYQCALIALLSCKESLKIVEVGANDGQTADPLYEFAMAFKDRTDITLIEPNSKLVPYLEQSYVDHPSHKIANCAIGPKGQLVLHAVSPSIWNDLDVSYANDWPIYRAPTGVTSTHRAHVENWLRKHLPDKSLLDHAIIELIVESAPLMEVLNRLHSRSDNNAFPIDVLQVDTEGFDAEVIYQSSIDETAPSIIYFESRHLSADRIVNLRIFLDHRGYIVTRQGGGNSLAIQPKLQT